MKLGKFHLSFLQEFSPVVMQYVEGLEADLRDDLMKSFATEQWVPVRYVCVRVYVSVCVHGVYMCMHTCVCMCAILFSCY